MNSLRQGRDTSTGRCQYCGLDAGLLRNRHEECQEKHDRGWDRMLDLTAEAARTGQAYEKLGPSLAGIANYAYVPSAQIHEALVAGWERVALESIEDRVLSLDEESRLSGFAKRFQLSNDELDRNKGWTRIVMAACLRDVLEGKTPSRMVVSGELPFNFQRSEALVWAFKNVPYFEERTRTRYVGGSDGFSVRLAQGLYYRTSSFESIPVISEATVRIDTGYLGLTTKHVYFAGDRKGFRVPYKKIMAFQPFKDGFGIVRDAANAKPQSFQTQEGWFAYNLVRNLAAHSPA